MSTVVRTGQRRTLPFGIPVGILIPLAIALIGMAIWVYRFVVGLRPTTNLSDAYPWGLWIAFDVVTGVALAAGAFTMAAVYYVFNRKKYHPLVRPALVTGFVGYIIVILGLLADLAQPFRIWHLIIHWNIHSVLFEVGWSVMIYTTVMALELSPVVFEKFGWKTPLRIITLLTLPLVILGITVSTLHQSSLGGLFLLMPDKLHPLWYSPVLPLFFLVSAVGAGLGMILLESIFSSKALGRPVEMDLLSGIARGVPYVMGFYLLFKLVELAVAGDLGALAQGSLQSNMFLLELLVGIILPGVVFAIPEARKSVGGLLTGGSLLVVGLIINRINVTMVGLRGPAGVSYFPYWMEFAVTIGLIAMAVTAYTLIVHFFPILPEESEAS